MGVVQSTHSRRAFLVRAGALAGASVLWQVPPHLRLRGWDDPAYALETNLVRDSLNGLVAFVWPGNDAYSIAQGEATGGPGAIAADTTTAFIESLDRFIPAPDLPFENHETLPLSGAVANLLDVMALTVNPAAIGGRFRSPFARLAMAEKAEVFRRLEADTGVPDANLPPPFTSTTGNFQFFAGALPPLVALLAFSEHQVFDPNTRTLTAVPVGWAHTRYQGGDRTVPIEGWDELLGYYQGRTAADTEEMHDA